MTESVGHGLQCVRKRLAALQEDAADDPFENPRIADIDGARSKAQSNHRGGDLRRRSKRAGRKGQKVFNVGGQRDLNGQRAIFLPSGRRHEPVGHFFLQHQRGVAEDPAVISAFEQREQDGGGHVVGKVSRDAHGLLFVAQRAFQIQFEDVRLDDTEIRDMFADERGRQIAIDLHSYDASRSRCQRAGQRSAAGSDFEEGFMSRGFDGVDELGDPDRLEEVLAEPLPWLPSSAFCL